MARQLRNITFNDIQRATGAVLSENRRAFLIYFAVFLPLWVFTGWLDFEIDMPIEGSVWEAALISYDSLAIGSAYMLAIFFGQYLLFESVLLGRKGGQGGRAGRVLSFFGLTFLTYFGVSVALILLILPGLFLGTRWLMSPSFLVHRHMGTVESLRASWDATKGNTGSIMLSIVLLILVFVVVGGVMTLLGWDAAILQGTGPWLLVLIMDAALNEGVSVGLVAMSVGIYRLLGNDRGELKEVFE